MFKRYFIIVLLIFIALPIPFNGVFANEEEEEDVHFPTIIVNKSNNKLAYFVEGKLVKEYNVATGTSQKQTPEGRFTLVNPRVNPSYIPKRLPAGHKDNPLGTHWLGINYENTQGNLYGIHGTNNPSIIGKHTNQGTVSMRNSDIRELYEQVVTVPLTRVNIIIVSSRDSFERIYSGPTKVDPPIALFINGERQKLDQNPIIMNNRTLVPMRHIFERIGATVEWNEREKRIIATKGDKRLQLVVGSEAVRLNGVNSTIDVAPVIMNNRTLIPLRFVFTEFGAEVEWDSEKRSVFVNYKEDTPVTFYINDVAQRIIEKSEVIYRNQVAFSQGDKIIEELMVPASFIFEKFGAVIQYTEHDKRLIVLRNEQIAELIVGSKQMKINGRIDILDHAPIQKGNEVLVPLDLMQRLYGATRVIKDGPNPTVDLKYKLNRFVQVYFNDNLMLPYTGFVVDQASYLPLSLVFRELGAEIEENANGEIKIIREGTLIQMHLDSQSAFVNGRLVRVAAPPKRVDGQVIVPLRFVSEALGAEVMNQGPSIYINQR